MNNLNDRLAVIENAPAVVTGSSSSAVLSAADRAALDEVSAFLGIHSIVANTLESKAAGVAEIDPNTGLAVVKPDVAPVQPVMSQSLPQSGA